VDYGTGLVEHPDRAATVSALGVDETAFLRASPTRSTVFATGIVDLHRGQLIDIVPGRSRKVLADWLIARPAKWYVEVAPAEPETVSSPGPAGMAGAWNMPLATTTRSNRSSVPA